MTVRPALLSPIEHVAQADGFDLPESVTEPVGMWWPKRQRGLQRAFLTRMIFLPD